MSWVTNIMVSAAYEDRDKVEEFARWLRARPDGYVIREGWQPEVPGPDRMPYFGDLKESPKEAWPGPKYPECDVWLGVLDHADLRVVREYFSMIQWRVPNAVQLFLMDQEELFFRVWMFREGRLQQYAPLKPHENDREFQVPSPDQTHGG